MDPPTRVPDLLQARLASHADTTALAVDGGGELTYAQWQRRAAAFARGLAGVGVTAGDRVGLLFDNARWTDFASAYLGVLTLGAAAVPLSPRFAAEEVAGIAAHAGLALLVAPAELAPGDAGVTTLPQAAVEADHPGEPVDCPADSSDLAEIVYTSGTTGRPRGVACTHANLLAHDLPGGPGDAPAVFAHAFPVGTNAGQECLRMPLRRPATAVVLPTFDPDRLCALVAERGVAAVQLVPAMAQLLVDSGAPERHDVSGLRRLTLSSAPAPPALLARLQTTFPQATVCNAYALTEAGGARTVTRYDPDRPGSVGRPVASSEVRIVDEVGRTAPPEVVGEVWLRRPGAPSRWYHRDEEASAETFDDGWVKTGDLGYLDGDGHLHLVDRAKDLIVSGGANIASVEVEHALYEHDAVAEAAVFGLDHPVLGQQVAAAVVARRPVDVRELQATVRQHLGEHKVPRRVELLDALPRNDSGKTLKRALQQRFADEPAGDHSARAEPTAPRTPVESTVLGVWEEVLDRGGLGVHDDFFAAGGQSLAAAQVVARLVDAFDVDLPVTLVFERPTVAELARAVDDALAQAGSA